MTRANLHTGVQPVISALGLNVQIIDACLWNAAGGILVLVESVVEFIASLCHPLSIAAPSAHCHPKHPVFGPEHVCEGKISAWNVAVVVGLVAFNYRIPIQLVALRQPPPHVPDGNLTSAAGQHGYSDQPHEGVKLSGAWCCL